MEKVIVRDLAKKFMWTIVTGDSNSLNRPLTLADTNRPGLELAGYFPDTGFQVHKKIADRLFYPQIRAERRRRQRAYPFPNPTQG